MSHVPGFESELPIPTIPISVRTPSANSADASSGGSNVDASKTRADKRKVKVVTASPPSKARKVVGKKAVGLKINEPAPKMPSTLTPPNRTRGVLTMR
jgi:hypothetical protein